MEPRTAGARQEVFPVVDPSRRLLGIVTLPDLAALAGEADLQDLVCAADVMRPPISLREGDLLHTALELMTTEGVRALPVVDAEGRVLGMIDETAVALAYLHARALRRAASARAPSGGADGDR